MIVGYFGLLVFCAAVAFINSTRRRLHYKQILADRREQRIRAAAFESLRLQFEYMRQMTKSNVFERSRFLAERDHAINLLRRHS